VAAKAPGTLRPLSQGTQRTRGKHQRSHYRFLRFFRHYADKREVLFYGTEMMQQLLVEALAAAPASATAMDAVGAAFQPCLPIMIRCPSAVIGVGQVVEEGQLADAARRDELVF
jgi:hypothetical protein